MNTNGLRLAEDIALCEQLAELEVCVVLSFNTLDPDVSRQVHGRDVVAKKLQALENLTRAGVRVALLNMLIRGLKTPSGILYGVPKCLFRPSAVCRLGLQTAAA